MEIRKEVVHALIQVVKELQTKTEFTTAHVGDHSYWEAFNPPWLFFTVVIKVGERWGLSSLVTGEKVTKERALFMVAFSESKSEIRLSIFEPKVKSLVVEWFGKVSSTSYKTLKLM